MTGHDPTAAYRSHVVDECLERLARASRELRQVRDRFRPIFNYYININPRWLTVAARAFDDIRAVGQPPEVAEFGYRQISLDGTVVIEANEVVKAMLRRPVSGARRPSSPFLGS